MKFESRTLLPVKLCGSHKDRTKCIGPKSQLKQTRKHVYSQRIPSWLFQDHCTSSRPYALHTLAQESSIKLGESFTLRLHSGSSSVKSNQLLVDLLEFRAKDIHMLEATNHYSRRVFDVQYPCRQHGGRHPGQLSNISGEHPDPIMDALDALTNHQ